MFLQPTLRLNPASTTFHIIHNITYSHISLMNEKISLIYSAMARQTTVKLMKAPPVSVQRDLLRLSTWAATLLQNVSKTNTTF